MQDLKNCKFNKLTALEPLYKYQREWVWLCKCDCGNETNVRISKLKNGTTKSCGCHKNTNLKKGNKSGPENPQWTGHGEISGSFFGRIKNGASDRNLEFNLSIEYMWDLFLSQNRRCAYTGIDIRMPINVRELDGDNNENLASLDRIDNSLGYIEGNVQWVCKRLNYMKHIMNDYYFLDLVKKIYNYRIKDKLEL